ncbi:MAG: hypothetical protein GY757_32960, partial [bacterium]|nr:hypothetical protein [bacterium]
MISKFDEDILLLNPVFMKQKEYWTAKLAGDITVTEISFVSKKELREEGDMEEYESLLPGDLTRRLTKLSKESALSLYIILTAALKTLIYKYTGKEDIGVISPLNKWKISEETINSRVYIHDRLKGDMTFKELILQTRKSVLEAYKNQDYPADRIIDFLFGIPEMPETPGTTENSGTPGDTSNRTHQYVSNIVCSLNMLHSARNAGEIKGRLSFIFQKEENQFKYVVRYDTGIYDKYYIEQISNHFTTVLANAIDDLDTTISTLSFLSEQERKTLIYGFNDVPEKEKKPVDKKIEALFSEQVERTPQKTAVVFEGEQHSYRELNE